MGSWVALTTDNKGRLIASDQGGAGLFMITPGSESTPTRVEKLPVDLSGAQGLLWAFDSLYVVVNGGAKSGLHRVRDTDGDGLVDSAEHCMHLDGGGEHGPHAVILSLTRSRFSCIRQPYQASEQDCWKQNSDQLERRSLTASALGCQRTRGWDSSSGRLDLRSRSDRKELDGSQHGISKPIRYRSESRW